jgi:hypothetical protein
VGSRPSDLFGTLDADALRKAFARDLAASAERLSTDWPLTTMPPAPPYAPGLTEADVRRIVREEMEAARPKPSVLDVTPEDVRRWIKVRGEP